MDVWVVRFNAHELEPHDAVFSTRTKAISYVNKILREEYEEDVTKVLSTLGEYYSEYEIVGKNHHFNITIWNYEVDNPEA